MAVDVSVKIKSYEAYVFLRLKAFEKTQLRQILFKGCFPHFNSVAAVLIFQHKRELLPSLFNQN